MKSKFQRIKQPVPDELTAALLDFLRRKFYTGPGDDKCFFQDRRHLLTWVVLWPASWLNKKGVTIHGDAYREIFFKVFFQAAANMTSSKVKYRPAYLREVIQSHFKIHGEDYYNDAKSVRNLADHAMMLVGQFKPAAPDPVRELALARQLLVGSKKKVKTVINGPVNLELKLS